MVIALPEGKLGSGVVLGIIVAAPLLLYLIASGDVAEVSGPGGLVAKFKADARAPVDTSAEIEALELVAKLALPDPLQRSRQFRPGAPIALTLRLGDPTSSYDRYAIETYISALIKVDPELTVIFITVDGVFKASTDGHSVISIVNNDHYGGELEQAIKDGDIPKIETLLTVSKKNVEKAESNATALKKMIDAGVKSLVAVDPIGRPVGVVRRDRIVAKLVASLAA